MDNPIHLKSITAFHRLLGLKAPQHPLIGVVDYSSINHAAAENKTVFLNFYAIGLKRDVGGKLHYGQQVYDFDEGLMSFVAPSQVIRFEIDISIPSNPSGYLLLLHPDFLWGTHLAKSIKKYEYFNYAIKEALFLSEKEEEVIESIFQNIQREYHKDIDKFTQSIILAQIETLLNYADRFYQRQFVTRNVTSNQTLSKVEDYLESYFKSENLTNKGLPTVQLLADDLCLSPIYLSNLLKQLTGISAQQHIHEKLIKEAKEKLSTTNLSVSRIAYELGFEHSQSFSKLFKSKSGVSPLEFRASFN
jgi:AraC family transcriptional activator of pobA